MDARTSILLSPRFRANFTEYRIRSERSINSLEPDLGPLFDRLPLGTLHALAGPPDPTTQPHPEGGRVGRKFSHQCRVRLGGNPERLVGGVSGGLPAKK